MDYFLEKVTAFVTRDTEHGPQLLLFEHPVAGIQLPAGTVEEGELHLNAVLREATEETGLHGFSIGQYIGSIDTCLPKDLRFILRTTKVYARPDCQSFDWAEFRRGISVSCHRTKDGYSHVTYEEGDQYPNPNYITYSITGWVPSGILAKCERRYLYHLTYNGDCSEQWSLHCDNHLFHLFWAPLEDLPCIIKCQQEWLDYATKTLGYRFG
ncbi:MAG: NUDIX domain-containing protein [Armatimonadota bacterium]|nr:NUDIX domain-containing protein [bacterium]